MRSRSLKEVFPPGARFVLAANYTDAVKKFAAHAAEPTARQDPDSLKPGPFQRIWVSIPFPTGRSICCVDDTMLHWCDHED